MAWSTARKVLRRLGGLESWQGRKTLERFAKKKPLYPQKRIGLLNKCNINCWYTRNIQESWRSIAHRYWWIDDIVFHSAVSWGHVFRSSDAPLISLVCFVVLRASKLSILKDNDMRWYMRHIYFYIWGLKTTKNIMIVFFSHSWWGQKGQIWLDVEQLVGLQQPGLHILDISIGIWLMVLKHFLLFIQLISWFFIVILVKHLICTFDLPVFSLASDPVHCRSGPKKASGLGTHRHRNGAGGASQRFEESFWGSNCNSQLIITNINI